MGEQTIYCTVASCYYNEGGDRCRAESIQVRVNPRALGETRFEVGAIGDRQAVTSEQTQCQTFIPRDQGPKPGVRRLS